MAGLPQFPISTQTDPYWEIPMYDAAGNPLSIEGRVFEAWIAPATTKQGVAEPVEEIKVLTFQDGLSLVPPTDGTGDQTVKNTLVHQVSRAFAQANFPRGELTADLLEVVDGARRLFAPVRLFYADPAQIREFVADRAGITFGQGRQPIVTPVAIAGQAGRRGSGLLTGTLPPQPSDGEDGDYWVVEREGQANLVYGPKENGEWPPQPSSTFGVGGVADVPGLPEVLDEKTNTEDLPTTPIVATYGSVGRRLTDALSDLIRPEHCPGLTFTEKTQFAIDYAWNNGGGCVQLPRGDVPLVASKLAETFYNAGSPVSAATACLAVRTGVRLRGDGQFSTLLKCTDPKLSLIYVVTPDNYSIEDMTLWGGFVSPQNLGAGHGIIQLSATTDYGYINNMLLRNLFIRNVASYGASIQNGDGYNNRIENVRISFVGADGLDLKARGGSEIVRGLFVSQIYIDTYSQRVPGSAGIDIRGRFQGDQICIMNVGKGMAGTEGAFGLRYRTVGPIVDGRIDPTAQYSMLTNLIVEGALGVDGLPLTNTVGLVMGSLDCKALGGTILNVDQGVAIAGNANGTPDHNILQGFTVDGAKTRAFTVGSGVKRAKLLGCSARNSPIGFRNEGDFTSFIGCESDPATVPAAFSTSTAALATEMRKGRSATGWITEMADTAGIVTQKAMGTGATTELRLEDSFGGGISMFSNGKRAVRFGNTGTEVNYWNMSGGNAGALMAVAPSGTDTDISVRIGGKGAGSAIWGIAGGKVGFFGISGTARPTVSGSRGGNAALASLLTSLNDMGLIANSTTA